MEFERKILKQTIGSDETTTLELVTDMSTGKSKLELHREITQRFKTSELSKAEGLYEKLTCGGGRRVLNIEDLVNIK